MKPLATPNILPPKYLGFVCNQYTPQVEGQLTRDLIAALNTPLASKYQLTVVSTEDRCKRLLDSLNVRFSNALDLATTWIAYQTAEDKPEVPEHARTTIERNLFQRKRTLELDTTPRPGYYMQPQGRPVPDSISMHRPAPSSGYTPPNPLIVLIWG